MLQSHPTCSDFQAKSDTALLKIIEVFEKLVELLRLLDENSHSSVNQILKGKKLVILTSQLGKITQMLEINVSRGINSKIFASNVPCCLT